MVNKQSNNKASSTQQEITITSVTKRIALMLHQVTSLPEIKERAASYYCLATWFLDRINPIPLLCILGPNGTGKSQLLSSLGHLAYQPYRFTASNMTPPTMRDELGKAHDRTAIIDEADADGLESFLNLRYLRETAICYVKIPAGPDRWKTCPIPIFGPSIVHKRVPFKDPAVDGRSIIINTVPDNSRRYLRADNLKEEEIADLQIAQAKLKVSLKISANPYIPKDIAPRVADSYRPLIALASIEQDDEFLKPLFESLLLATRDLADGQSYEPGPIIVQALLRALTNNEQIALRNVKLEGDLIKIIQYEFGFNLNSRQVAKILRGYGFELRRIGGPYSVIPDINTLVKVCNTIGIEDEALNRAAAGIIDPWRLEE